MVVIEDHAHFLAISGIIIATVAYFAPCVSHKAWWLKGLFSILIAQQAYGILAAQLPDYFGYDVASAVGTMFFIACICVMVARVAVEIAALGAVMLLLGPILMHNISLLTTWLRANVSADIPPYVGVIAFGVVIVLVLVLLYTVRAVTAVMTATFVVVGSLVLFVYARMVVIESDGSTELKCEWASEEGVAVAGTNETRTIAPDNTRCPLSLGAWENGMLFIGLLVFSATMTWTYHTRAWRRGRAYKKLLNAKAPPPRDATTTTPPRAASDAVDTPRR